MIEVLTPVIFLSYDHEKLTLAEKETFSLQPNIQKLHLFQPNSILKVPSYKICSAGT
jgi:hypothetical protein